MGRGLLGWFAVPHGGMGENGARNPLGSVQSKVKEMTNTPWIDSGASAPLQD